MNKAEAILRVLKVRELGRRPGTAEEGKAAGRVARHIMERHGITEAELLEQESLFGTEAEAPPAPAEQPPQHRRAEPAVILRDHRAHPERVHMAVNDMVAICGVRPTFVWSELREIAIASGVPCPHCLDLGIVDARKPWERIDSAPRPRLS